MGFAAKRRSVLVIQSDPFSRLNAPLAAVITSNTGLAAMPGNVFLPAATSGLSKDSVVNVPPWSLWIRPTSTPRRGNYRKLS
jgi:mRNA-degrading endonuclease toxin of MazEF toxin-antitoxin module